jgi:uncharacterized delta-60 repeat protein
MALSIWLAALKTRCEGNQPWRTRRRTASARRATAKLRIERVEERLALSGFGPEDGAYIVEPWNGRYDNVEVQPSDQKIVAAGVAAVGGGPRVAVARYDALGNADATYGSGGLATPLLGPVYRADALVLQPDGKAVVAGYAFDSGSSGLGVARLNVDGSPDDSFGSGGWTRFDVQPGSDAATAVSLQSTGKVLVVGNSYSSTDPSTTILSALAARFTASGAIDSGKGGFGQPNGKNSKGYTLSTFGARYNYFNDLAVQPDDKIVAVGGIIIIADGTTHHRLVIARYTTAGVLDKTFNGSGYSVLLPAAFSYTTGRAVVLQSDGKIVVAGSSSGLDGSSDMLVAKYNANGTLDTGFGGGSGYVRLDIDGNASATNEQGASMAIQPDGKIVVAGTEHQAPGFSGIQRNVLVARINADGTSDQTFGTGGFKLGSPPAGPDFHDFNAQAVALQSDGSIIVAGTDYWGTTGSTQHPLLMRFFGDPTAGSALQALGSVALAPSSAPRTAMQTLTTQQVQPVLAEAIARWQAAGADVSKLGSLDVRITDLGGTTLGVASGNTIWLDDNAAGWGWFVDATPWDDAEFTTRGNQGEKLRMDLLTVLMHEMGHLLGLDHDVDGLMADTLAAGTRQTGTEHGGELTALDFYYGQEQALSVEAPFADLFFAVSERPGR